MRRICFIGASTTEGMGDERGLGWPGRLWQAHRERPTAFVSYNLGIRGQTLNQIRKRARAECAARLGQTMGPLIVLGTGANDLSRFTEGDYAGKLRTPHSSLLKSFQALLEDLRTVAPVVVIGPPPIDEAQMPYRLANQMLFDFSNGDIRTGSLHYAELCNEANVPYFDLFDALNNHPVYRRALNEGDGLHPSGDGYQACADKIDDWIGWNKALNEGWVR